MKKVFSIIMAIAAAVTVHAATTEVAKITLTGSGSPAASYITLRVDPTVLSPETGSYFENKELPENVNLYVIADGKFSSYKLNELKNLALGFITNRKPAGDQTYTLTFAVSKLTDGLTLTDLRTGTTTDIVDGETYEFEVNTTNEPGYEAGTNYEIADRFVINFEAGALDVCFIGNKLTISHNPYYTQPIVIKNAAGTKVSEHLGSSSLIDLTDDEKYPAGRYTVEFGDAKKLVIVKE